MDWFHTLKVLMWKHWTVRLRRYIFTTIELFFPIVSFLILFIYKDDVNPKPRSFVMDKYNIRNTEPMLLSDFEPPTSIYYSPASKFTDSLMEMVSEQLYPKQQSYRELGRKTDAIPVSSYNDLKDSDVFADKNVAVVNFLDTGGNLTTPKHLNYTIRMNQMFHTSSLGYWKEGIGYHENYGTVYQPFMRLQWAIDSSYIKLLTGNDVKQRVSVQEFPFVRARKNDGAELVSKLAQSLCWMSLLLPFISLTARIVEERVTGIKDLFQLVGVSDELLVLSHFLNVLPVGLIYSIVIPTLLTATDNPLLRHSSGALMALVLMLHFLTMIVLAYIVSFLLRSLQYVTSMAVYAYLLVWLPVRFMPQSVPLALQPLAGLLPNAPLYWYWTEVEFAETQDSGITASTMTTVYDGAASVLMCIVYLVLQLLLLGAIAYYLATKNLGRGERLSWRDHLRKILHSKSVGAERVPEDEPEGTALEPPAGAEYFESAPDNKEVGIRVLNVTKVYNKQAVLKDVSMDVYKGEITVLLGHNGAGKTTLMSIITGMLSATSGKVYVDGMDTAAHKNVTRRRLGFCPQHNLFLPYLTVIEHVMLFTMLKGSSLAESKKTSQVLLDKLGIGDKARAQSSQLSGGMKRRLQLACALAGDSSVLVLDEPTSGLDVETRRELWDLLLSLRGSRTVLISTHFMEEADALGDRVAALHLGRLRCHATTMHLKRAIGTGYRLSFTTIGYPKEPAITALVTSHVRDATLKGMSLNSLSYNLPATYSGAFPKLFAALEASRPELGIDSIGVGVSTIEEVFLKLCSDTETTFTEDALDAAASEPIFARVAGLRLRGRQLGALLRRQLRFVRFKAPSYIFVHWMLPIIFALAFTSISNELGVDPPDSEESLSLDLGRYKEVGGRALFNVDDPAALRRSSEGHPDVKFEKSQDVYGDILEISRRNIKEYAHYLIGLEINETDAKIYYSTVYRHTAPVALNVLANAAAARALPWAGARTVETRNHPLATTTSSPRTSPMKEPKGIAGCFIWTAAIVFLVLATISNCLTLAVKERVTGARRLQLMAGCPPELYWMASLVAHAVLYGAPLVLAPIVAAAALDKNETFTQPDFLGVMALLIILGILAFLPLGYLVAFRYGERGVGMVMLLLLLVFGLITPSVKSTISILQDPKKKGFRDYLLDIVSYTATPHTFLQGAVQSVTVARLNAYCALNRDKCPQLVVAETGFDADKCCAMENPRCYFCFDDYSPLLAIIALFVQAVVFMILVVVSERGYFSLLWDRLRNARYSPAPDDSDVDAMARAERAYVGKMIMLPERQIQDMMLVDELHKNYTPAAGRACNAVRGVSFSVKKGECFGLLGVNGAGKSTTFKMLTAEEPATRGRVFADRHHLRFHRSTQQYTKSLGYCPQFFGLDEFLTGKQNLELLLTMRGLGPADVAHEASAWIQVVGLEKYSKSRVKDYSGGCARRLATAAALSGGAAVALLDEPSAGVDVAARRRVWAAVRRALRSQRALIVSSHSMEEMEALCARIGIMSRGRLRALGPAAELRAAHAAGHAVLVKLRAPAGGDVTDSAGPKVDQLKSAFHQHFDCTLKDEHTTMLHFHINESMSYSNLFSALEALRRDFPDLLEDYSVTETTLEEVFLSFAKEAAPSPDHRV